MTDPTGIDEWRDRIAQAERRGEYFRAYDDACTAVARFPDDWWFAQHAVLNLANAGALELAEERFAGLHLDAFDVPEVLALHARLLKSRALRLPEPARTAVLHDAIGAYQRCWDSMRSRAITSDLHYPAINVATLALLAGDRARAGKVAREVLDLTYDGVDDWAFASRTEALAILGDWASFERHFEALRERMAADATRLATVLRQLSRVLAAQGRPLPDRSAWLARVVHFAGHRAMPGVAWDEIDLRARIDAVLDGHRIGSAFGALAAGADILIAEALLDRGCALHVVLPFAIDDFIARSVSPSGEDWVARFHRCLARAGSVRLATDDADLGDTRLFAYNGELAMGLCALQARHLGARALQIVLWDGEPARAPGGTGDDVARWRGAGRDTLVVDLPRTMPAIEAPTTAPVGREVHAMLFADVKGFSRLNDAQIPRFAAEALRRFGDVFDRFATHTRMVNTWGDGLFAVFADVVVAARCALQLQAATRAVDAFEAGLAMPLCLRIGGHVGPVYRFEDPVLHRTNFLGVHVNRAARIEPIAPDNSIYVTENFAALLALHAPDEFACDYVGLTEMAKGAGRTRIFLLRQALADDDGPTHYTVLA